MAVVEFSIKDLESLVGRKLTKEELADKIVMMGFSLEKMEKDKVFYEVMPNRPDMLSVEGFARSVRYFLGMEKRAFSYEPKPSGISIKVDRTVKAVRPFVAAAVIKNVNLTDELVASLMQMQEKLHETLGRKRRKVAIGVHDLDKVVSPFVYLAAEPESISFVPLDMSSKLNLREICMQHPKGIKYSHILENADKWPVILDSKKEILSFPPIINGELTRVSRKTKNVFIDVTGTSSQAVTQALNIICAAMLERGCVVQTVDVIDGKTSKTPDFNPYSIKVDNHYVSRILGVDISAYQIKSLLLKMCIGYENGYAIVPAFRTDIMHPIDIAEEVAIAYGYAMFKPEMPSLSTISKRNQQNEFFSVVRESMCGAGCQEVMSMILTNEEDEFTKMEKEREESCEASNPLTSECTMCRRSILPSLLRTLSQNKNRDYPQKIFEIGIVVLPERKAETGSSDIPKLACAISDINAGYEGITPILGSLMRDMGLSHSLEKATEKSFIQGRVAAIVVNGRKIGIVGEINPKVLENWKLEKPVSVFEINLEEVMQVLGN